MSTLKGILPNRSILPLKILVAALVIRLILAPFTGHPYDMSIWINTGEQVAAGRSPYDLTYHLGYPDPWAFWTGISYLVASAFGGNKFVYILTMKLPIIFGDIAIVLILIRLAGTIRRTSTNVDSAKLTGRIVSDYLLNPFVIVVGSVWGMMDNLAAALVVLFFLFANDGKPKTALFAYWLSVLLKLYPIIFLPLVVLHLRNSSRSVRAFLADFLGVTLATVTVIGIIPFYLFGWNIWIFLYSTYHQLFRDPGGISPLGILESIRLLEPSFPFVEITASWWFGFVRFAWLIALGATVVLLARKGGRTCLSRVFSCVIAVSLVWYLFFAWVSEQNVLLALIFILARGAWSGEDGWRRSFWAGSSITLGYVIFNVPVWRFLFPFATIGVESELWSNFVRPIALILLSAAFCFFVVWELRRTVRFMGRLELPTENA